MPEEELHFPVPVRIVLENRRSARIALRKKQIIIRLPKLMKAADKKQATKELLSWAKKTIIEKALYPESDPDRYAHGQSILLLGNAYEIEHAFSKGTRSSMHLAREGKLRLTLPGQVAENQDTYRAHCKQLMIKGLSTLFLPDMRARVLALNRKHFNVQVNKVSLRYTTSRWGSCSSSGAISLSTKLLLTPPEVCDYVMIHELAHRIEMNHSKAFWAHVASAMPEYEMHLQWLKTEGKLIDF
jgi:predicted metal-dependent hydrolase